MKTFLTIFFLFLSTSVFAECVSGDCANGYGTKVWYNGDKYVGEFKNQSINGEGTYTSADGYEYVGEWKDNFREGLGIVIFGTGEREGEKYVGEWKDHQMEGQGTYTYANGTTETGIWKNFELVTPNNITTDEKRIAKLFLSTSVFEKCVSGDCANGYGTYVWYNGDKYVGEFKNNTIEGQGTYTYADGYKYVGEWKDNFLEGLGIVIVETGEREGEKYVGEWKNGYITGQGTFTSADGTTETGIWKNFELVTPNNITTDEKRIAKNLEIAEEKRRAENVEKEKRIADKKRRAEIRAKIAEREKRIAEEKRRAEIVEKQKRLSNDVWDTYENVNYNFVCTGVYPFDAIAETSVNVLISALKEWNLDGWNFYWQSYITLGEGYQCNKINVAQSRESFKIKKNEMIRFGEATHWGKTFDIYRYDTGGAAGKAYAVYLMW